MKNYATLEQYHVQLGSGRISSFENCIGNYIDYIGELLFFFFNILENNVPYMILDATSTSD